MLVFSYFVGKALRARNISRTRAMQPHRMYPDETVAGTDSLNVTIHLGSEMKPARLTHKQTRTTCAGQEPTL